VQYAVFSTAIQSDGGWRGCEQTQKGLLKRGSSTDTYCDCDGKGQRLTSADSEKKRKTERMNGFRDKSLFHICICIIIVAVCLAYAACY
jgi:hypothetical protein